MKITTRQLRALIRECIIQEDERSWLGRMGGKISNSFSSMDNVAKEFIKDIQKSDEDDPKRIARKILKKCQAIIAGSKHPDKADIRGFKGDVSEWLKNEHGNDFSSKVSNEFKSLNTSQEIASSFDVEEFFEESGTVLGALKKKLASQKNDDIRTNVNKEADDSDRAWNERKTDIERRYSKEKGDDVTKNREEFQADQSKKRYEKDNPGESSKNTFNTEFSPYITKYMKLHFDSSKEPRNVDFEDILDSAFLYFQDNSNDGQKYKTVPKEWKMSGIGAIESYFKR